jgi:SAM-dependent methyltransferase
LVNGQSESVRRYYEANTGWMLARGSGRGEGVIHRPVWLPGTSSRPQAARAVDSLILARLADPSSRPAGRRGPLRLLDFGCGSGATAVWLARHLAAEVTGVTLSPRQVRLARHLAERRGVADLCRFLEGDFLEGDFLEESLRGERFAASRPGGGAGPAVLSNAGFDALYAIEAFSHAAEPDAFTAQAAHRLAPGGLLFVCDDFRADGGSRGPRARSRRRWMEAFRRGWHLGTLRSEGELVEAAERRRLDAAESIDLTPYLRDRSAPARFTYRLLQLVPGNGPRLASQRGGAALQVCLHEGWVRYLFLVFRKR